MASPGTPRHNLSVLDAANAPDIVGGWSEAFSNKELLPGYTKAALGNSYVQQARPLDAVIKHQLDGKSAMLSAHKNNRRTNDTFRYTQVGVVDAEAPLAGNAGVAEALAVDFNRRHAFLIFPTASSGKVTDKNPHGYTRSRIEYLFSEPVADVERARAIYRALSMASEMPTDRASFKPAQPWHGSTNRIEQPHIDLQAEPVNIWWLAGYLVDEARAEMERDLAPKPPMITPTGTRAEKYSAAAVTRILDDYYGVPAHAGQRHEAFVKMSVALIALQLGGWHGTDNIETSIWEAGRATERTDQEIRAAIKWARAHATPKPFELPGNRPLRVVQHLVDYAQTPTGELPCYHVGGLPNEWRAPLLALDSAAAVTLETITDALNAALLDDPASIELADVLRAALAMGRAYSASTYRKGFNFLKNELFRDLHTEKNTKTVCKTARNPVRNEFRQGGRRAGVLSLPPLAEQKQRIADLSAPRLYERAFPAQDKPDRPAIVADLSARAIAAVDLDADEAAQIADEINAMSAPAYQSQEQARRKAQRRARALYAQLMDALDDATHTPLPDGWNPFDVQSYRAALLRARMLADPERLRSRRLIAGAIGISPRSVDTYLQLAGVEITSPIEGEYEEYPITSPHDVERAVTRLAYEAQGKPRKIIACRADGESIEMPYTSETASDFVPQQFAAGATITVKIQVANRHAVDMDAQPPAAAPRQAPPAPPEQVVPDPLGTTPAQTTVDPIPERRQQVGYHRQWVRDQLVLRLRLMGWQQNGRLINPNTGEIAALDADARELIALMLGREIGIGDDPLLAYALSEGAVITRLA